MWDGISHCGKCSLVIVVQKEKARGNVNPETLITMQSEDLSMTVSKNGLKSYHLPRR